jgi:hypothetical protein
MGMDDRQGGRRARLEPVALISSVERVNLDRPAVFRPCGVGFVVGALVLPALGGCVAQIREDRIYGPPRLSSDSSSQVVTERHDAPPTLVATAQGLRIEATVTQETECRDVTVTSPVVRDVEIARTFADDAQNRNAALSILAGTAVGLIAYGEDQASCATAACNTPVSVKTAAVLTASAAAVPLAFLAYNALRVQNGHGVEETTPAMAPGPWRPCDARPLHDEPVSVNVADRTLSARTDPQGHAVIDVPPDVVLAGSTIAVVRHSGSADVAVALEVPAAP